PARALASDPDPRRLEALVGRDPPGLGPHELAAFLLGAVGEGRPVTLPTGELALDPGRPVVEQAVDLARGGAAGDDEQRAAPGRQLDARASGAGRDADLDLHAPRVSSARDATRRRARRPGRRGDLGGRRPK